MDNNTTSTIYNGKKVVLALKFKARNPKQYRISIPSAAPTVIPSPACPDTPGINRGSELPVTIVIPTEVMRSLGEAGRSGGIFLIRIAARRHSYGIFLLTQTDRFVLKN
jgi:hypothetical protein